ncbi:VC0807 family protein [Nocardia paucivorans]|uniref:VC0807 family protein n=1 Tax=Nocardia paucivorans TaxID=114259 RepID=UPI0002E09B23|nr:VC0807 family protein [Nocardia paucivorans]
MYAQVTPGMRALVPSLVLNGAVPLLVYLLARPHLGSDVVALAIAMAVPVFCTIASFARRRKPDVIGIIAVAAFGIALCAVLLSGGDPFVLELQEAVVTGPIGLVFLISVALRRPALLAIVRLLKRPSPGAVDVVTEQRRHHVFTVLTTIMGVTFVVHALALTVLALLLSSAQVLVLSRPVGLTIIGLGFVILLWYRGRMPRDVVEAG